MSAIAGQRSAIMGSLLPEAQHGGQGTLVTGVHENVDIPGSTYVIFGGGVAATNAANVALGLNAKVIIIELNDDRIKYLEDMYAEKDVTVVKSTPENLAEQIKKSRCIYFYNFNSRCETAKIGYREMVKSMKKVQY